MEYGNNFTKGKEIKENFTKYTQYYILKKERVFMKWEDVRKTYPNTFVKLQILDSHLEGNNKIIDDMAVIKVIDDNKSATKELMNCSEGTVVYHTANENITIEVKNIRAYRGRI